MREKRRPLTHCPTRCLIGRRTVLEIALAVRACLVSGNLSHFPKQRCHGAKVVSPAEFVQLFRNRRRWGPSDATNDEDVRRFVSDEWSGR